MTTLITNAPVETNQAESDAGEPTHALTMLALVLRCLNRYGPARVACL